MDNMSALEQALNLLPLIVPTITKFTFAEVANSSGKWRADSESSRAALTDYILRPLRD